MHSVKKCHSVIYGTPLNLEQHPFTPNPASAIESGLGGPLNIYYLPLKTLFKEYYTNLMGRAIITGISLYYQSSSPGAIFTAVELLSPTTDQTPFSTRQGGAASQGCRLARGKEGVDGN